MTLALGMTVMVATALGAQQATPPAAPPNAPALDLSAVSLPIPAAGRLVAITNATIMTASGATIPKGTIVIRDGKIAAVGADVAVPAGAKVIDGAGKYVTPGIIDAHSHSAAEAINEGTLSITSMVRIEDVLRQDGISLYRQLAGGTTTLNILPRLREHDRRAERRREAALRATGGQPDVPGRAAGHQVRVRRERAPDEPNAGAGPAGSVPAHAHGRRGPAA
jgi:hypothetical protein